MLVIPWTRAHPLQRQQLLCPVPVSIQHRITGRSRHLGHIPHADETNPITRNPGLSLLIICCICHSRNDHDVLKTRLMTNSYHWLERRTQEVSSSVPKTLDPYSLLFNSSWMLPHNILEKLWQFHIIILVATLHKQHSQGHDPGPLTWSVL